MPADLNEFIRAIRELRLLSAAQERELSNQARRADAHALGQALVAKGWLTAYQLERILAGAGSQLRLGDYCLLEPLGEGGMGQVFKARHSLMNRLVAIKLIHPNHISRPQAVDRFRREIQAAAQLSHPNIVLALDAQHVNGRHFLVMEYCEGVTLGKLVRQRGPMSPARACDYIRQAAIGLQHAFERGLVHRDIKPDNLLVSLVNRSPQTGNGPGAADHGQIKILDMGLARFRTSADGEESKTLTREGTVLGTPDFLAPEQALDVSRADTRSDIYSLGCTFYFMLSGQVPFPGGTAMEKILRQQTEQPVPLERLRPDTPRPILKILEKMMAKAPADRFQSPGEIANSLLGVDVPSSSASYCAPTVSFGNMTSEAIAKTGAAPTFVPKNASPEDYANRKTAAAEIVRNTQWRKRLVRPWLLAAGGLVGILLLVGWLTIRPPVGKSGPPINNSIPPPDPAKIDNPVPVAGPPTASRTVGENEVLALAFTTREEVLAAGCGNPYPPNQVPLPGAVFRWGPVEGKADKTIPTPAGPVRCLTFSPDGKSLAWGIGSWNFAAPGFITIWDLNSDAPRASFQAHKEGVYTLAYHPDGKLLATGGREPTIRLWDPESGKKLADLDGHTGKVNQVVFSRSGKLLASAGEDGNVMLWDVSSLKRLAVMPGPAKQWVSSVAFSPDEQTMIAGSGVAAGGEAEVLVWDVPTRQQIKRIAHGYSHIMCLLMHPEGKIFVTGTQDGVARAWGAADYQLRKSFSHGSVVNAMTWTNAGQQLATGGGWNSPVKLWPWPFSR